MSDVVSLPRKCMFRSHDVMAPWRSLCASCFDERNRKDPEPTAVEILAMDLSDMQDDVAELHRRLSGKGKLSEEEAEADSARPHPMQRSGRSDGDDAGD
jgi:hypothetical protein